MAAFYSPVGGICHRQFAPSQWRATKEPHSSPPLGASNSTGGPLNSILVPKTYTYWHQDPLSLPLTDANRAVGKHSGAGGVFGKLYQLFTFTQDEVRKLTIM